MQLSRSLTLALISTFTFTAHNVLSDTTHGEAFSPFPAPFLLSTASPSLLQPCLTPIDHAARLDATHDPETGCPSPRNDSFERSAARLDPRWRRPWRSRRTAKRYAVGTDATLFRRAPSIPSPLPSTRRPAHSTRMYIPTRPRDRNEGRSRPRFLAELTRHLSSRRTASWSGPRLSANRFGRRAKQPARLLVIDAHRLEPGYRFVR